VYFWFKLYDSILISDFFGEKLCFVRFITEIWFKMSAFFAEKMPNFQQSLSDKELKARHDGTKIKIIIRQMIIFWLDDNKSV
jgi:hypothetical protein